MQRLERLEIHAANACNLTCESCSHFSNSGHRGVLSIEEAAEWLEPWRQRLDVGRFQIVGGEPTLNPRLGELVLLARKTFPSAMLGITTNGFFLHRHPELGSILARCRADLNFSIHDEAPDYMTAVQAGLEIARKWRRLHGIEVGLRPSGPRWTRRHKGFGPHVSPYEDGDPAASWARCDARFCRQIFRRRLWKCSPIAYLRLQKEAYPAISEKWDPYLAYSGLSPDCSEDELMAFLQRAAEPICGMCSAHTESFSKPSPLIPRAKLLDDAKRIGEKNITPDDSERPMVLMPPPPAFGITIYDEGAGQLEWCLTNVRSAYASAPVFVVSDGLDLEGYSVICRRYGARYRAGERLKELGHGARWWQRFFELAYSCGTPYAFKIDPDTQLHRPFTCYPPLDLFGCLDGTIVQGGIQGFSRSAIERILFSNFCMDPAYREVSSWAIDPMSRQYAQTKHQISTDYILHHITRRLGLRHGAWAEVDSMWKQHRPFRRGVAATHPHKCPPTKNPARCANVTSSGAAQ